MAIMGFCGGSLIGAPLANLLMDCFHSHTSVGVWTCPLVLAAVYAVLMLTSALGCRVPPANWQPDGWANAKAQRKLVTHHDVYPADAHNTPQFWLIWLVLCLDVPAGIEVLGLALPCCRKSSAVR